MKERGVECVEEIYILNEIKMFEGSNPIKYTIYNSSTVIAFFFLSNFTIS